MVFLNKYLLSSNDVKVRRIVRSLEMIEHAFVLARRAPVYHLVPVRRHLSDLCSARQSEQDRTALCQVSVV